MNWQRLFPVSSLLMMAALLHGLIPVLAEEPRRISRPIQTEIVNLKGLDALRAEAETFVAQKPSADGRFIDAEDWPTQIRFTRLSKGFLTFQVRVNYGKASGDPPIVRWANSENVPETSIEPKQLLSNAQQKELLTWLKAESLDPETTHLVALGEDGTAYGQTSSIRFLVPDEAEPVFRVIAFLHREIFESKSDLFRVTRNDRKPRETPDNR
ncbi:MAG: hypothetical protein AAGA58_19090 [Verrucomicrobiota bacterium]